ncbi:hypothetical protein ACFLRC_04060 [Candidatus Altiarchaeota archaeon]
MESGLNTKEILKSLEKITGKSEDSLTRLYLRMLKGESWSYSLALEKILPDTKSQEAYRKNLNKFSNRGFLLKGKKYYVGGKPRIPFTSNPQIIHAWIQRYSFTDYEDYDAGRIIKNLHQKEEWISGLEEKIASKENLDLPIAIFSLYFMGKEVSNFFFKLLVISVVGLPTEKKSDQSSMVIFNLLLNILSNLNIDRTYDGVDYLGKRFFTDIYLGKAMSLLYSQGYRDRHQEFMRVAIIEDLVELILDPKNSLTHPSSSYKKFIELTFEERIENIFSYIDSQSDHLVKDYFGTNWKKKIAAYTYYTIEKTIDEHPAEVKKLLGHLKKNYDLTESQLNAISKEFRKKIRNPLRIWQMNTVI